MDKNEDYSLRLPRRGDLGALVFSGAATPRPGPGEVLIEVAATGLNFKDVLFALDLLPLEMELGQEAAGRVTALGEGVDRFRVGDRVVAMVSPGFCSHVAAPQITTALAPANLDLGTAAALPLAYLTAYYALVEWGHLKPGERILIHSASGGVGLAAVQIAHWIGAEVVATAGSKKKRDYLRSLGIDQVLDSRAADLVEGVMQATDGLGVDVVLNSLAGEKLSRSLDVLARYGRFLELGRRDILENRQLAMQVFERALSFVAVNVSPGLPLPDLDRVWQEMFGHIQSGHFGPPPVRTFPLTEIREAFGLMAEAGHIGKIVITHEGIGSCELKTAGLWLDSIREAEGGKGIEDGRRIRRHPLLGQRRATPLSDGLFESRLRSESARYLADHRVADSVVFPAAAAMEMVLAAVDELEPGRPVELTDLEFIEILTLDEERTVQLALDAEDDGAAFRFQLFSSSHQQDGSAGRSVWRRHVKGTVGRVSAQQLESGRVDIATLRERLGPVSDDSEFYPACAERDVHYGSGFQVVTQVQALANEALAKLRLPAAAGERGGYRLHPVLLDGAIQAVWAAMSGTEGTFLPVGMESFELLAEAGDDLWAHARMADEQPNAPDRWTADVCVFDEAGEPVFKLGGLKVARLGAGSPTKPSQTLALAASFTAEPLRDSLSFWMTELGMDGEVSFADYGQVLPALLDPRSNLGMNTRGLNVALVRMEDWTRVADPLRAAAADALTALEGRPWLRLPNRIPVAHLNRHETEYLYEEIFVDNVYFRHGITLPDDACVFDVGANIGLFSLLVRQRCPGASIHAFEPAPVTFEALRTNLELYCRDAVAANCGIGGESRDAKFTFYPRSSVFSGFHGELEQDREAVRRIVANVIEQQGQVASEELTQRLADEFMEDRMASETADVRIRGLSEIIEERGVKRIDLLKLDAEKCELEILRGIKDEHWPFIHQLVVEVHDRDGAVLSEICQLLEQRGYRVDIDEEALLGDAGFRNVYARRESAVDTAQRPGIVSEEQRLIERVDELAGAVVAAAGRFEAPLLLVFCPNSETSDEDSGARMMYERLEARFREEIQGVAGVHLLSAAQINDWYPVSRCHDPDADELGHVPYTEDYFIALGSAIARTWQSLRAKPAKVIAVDADDTLWGGLCGELGPEGVEVGGDHAVLQRMLAEQRSAGRLLCLCSKNNEADVRAVFDARNDMPLQWEDFAARRVNWESKAKNLRSIVEDLGLGLDSVVFIDDDAKECAEMEAANPEVVTIQWSDRNGGRVRFLDHVWAFDHALETAEDRQRAEFYRSNSARRTLERDVPTLAAFIAGLNLQIGFLELTEARLRRAAQLCQRTNQFNLSGRRHDENTLRRFMTGAEAAGILVEVRDRFGDYGVVGLMLFEIGSGVLEVETMALSCRALGRGVEHGMLARLAEVAIDRGCETIRACYQSLGRNDQVREFLKAAQPRQATAAEGAWVFEFDAKSLANLRYQPDDEVRTPSRVSREDRTIHDARELTARHVRIAEGLATVDDIRREVSAFCRKSQTGMVGDALPRTPVEELLELIWRQALGLDRIGIHDEFRSLGGHSLLATQIIARLRGLFGIDLPQRYLLESSTIAKLAEQVGEATRNGLRRDDIPLVAKRRDGAAPMSAANERMWLHDQMEGGSDTYNVSNGFTLCGELNPFVIRQGLSEALRRHDSLRTTFELVEGTPMQRVSRVTAAVFPLVDLSRLTDTEDATELAVQEARRRFELSRDHLFRGRLLIRSDRQSVLLITMHHIVSDGWSLAILNRELSAFHDRFSQGLPSAAAELPVQYADFAEWQNQYLAGDESERQLNYWRRELSGMPALTEMPGDRARPLVKSYRGGVERIECSAELTGRLKELGQREGATLFMTLFAAFNSFVYRLGGQEDLVIGTDVANRTRAEVEGLIGFFVNQLPIRTDLSANPTFRELIERVRQKSLAAYASQDLPFQTLVKELAPVRDLSVTPLIQIKFILMNVPPDRLKLSGIECRPFHFDRGVGPFDFVLTMAEDEGRMVGNSVYSADLFDRETVTDLLQCFVRFLEALCADPERRLDDFPLRSEANTGAASQGGLAALGLSQRDIENVLSELKNL